jgi:hypothetical protein
VRGELPIGPRRDPGRSPDQRAKKQWTSPESLTLVAKAWVACGQPVSDSQGAGAHEHFVRGVRDTLLHRSQPLATAHLVIAPTVLGDRAGITGAAAMVADAIFGIEAVDAVVS